MLVMMLHGVGGLLYIIKAQHPHLPICDALIGAWYIAMGVAILGAPSWDGQNR